QLAGRAAGGGWKSAEDLVEALQILLHVLVVSADNEAQRDQPAGKGECHPASLLKLLVDGHAKNGDAHHQADYVDPDVLLPGGVFAAVPEPEAAHGKLRE